MSATPTSVRAALAGRCRSGTRGASWRSNVELVALSLEGIPSWCGLNPSSLGGGRSVGALARSAPGVRLPDRGDEKGGLRCDGGGPPSLPRANPDELGDEPRSG